MTKKPRARLLIVDDNPEILSLLGVLFEEENCVVTKAKSVQEAREQLKQLNGDVDLVLSDIQMPEETGFDLLQWMKREFHERVLKEIRP